MDDALRIHDALLAGTLQRTDLTARGLGAFLGATTSRVYHHHGSLDGLLYAVASRGFQTLAARLAEVRGGGLGAAAEAFVSFGLDHPALHELMFTRVYDWPALRAAGVLDGSAGLAMWGGFVEALRAAGSPDPTGDARLLYAGLHGLVSLALSGRANLGQLDVSDRDAARLAARRLVARLLPASE